MSESTNGRTLINGHGLAELAKLSKRFGQLSEHARERGEITGDSYELGLAHAFERAVDIIDSFTASVYVTDGEGPRNLAPVSK